MKKTRYITFCALMSALSVVALLLGSLLELLDLTAVMLASIILLIVREEMGNGALSVYFSTLLIAFFILPSKLIACEYGLIAIYPVVKPLLEKLPKALIYPVKALYMVLVAFGTLLLMKFVFISESPMYIDVIYVVGSIVMLVLFDVLIFRFSMYYRFKLRHQLRIDKFFYKK